MWVRPAASHHPPTSHRTTTDSAGGKAASASYSQRTSLSAYGGIATGAKTGITARQGFIGQFFDVTGITVNAVSTNINEGSAQQLTATAQLDDGTSMVADSQWAWTVVSGPISDVSDSGVATAEPVYQDTPAMVRAQFQGFQATLGLTVLDTDPDNFGLYAGDGLPDLWQVQYFGTNNPDALPAADPDRDGQNNLLEYTAGTDPIDPDSKFKLGISVEANQLNRCAITFSPRLSDRKYVVESSLDLGSGFFSPLSGVSTNDVGPVRTVTDTMTFLPEQQYYRVLISKP